MVKLEVCDQKGVEIKVEKEDLEDSFYLQNGSNFSMDNSTEAGPVAEELLVFDDTIEVPGDIFTDLDLFKNMFNMDTWNTGLTELTKQKLMALLPNFPKNDLSEKMRTLEMLFGGQNIAFGNPLYSFRTEVLKGNLHPERKRMRQYVGQAKNREAKLQREEMQFRQMHDLLKSRKKLLEFTSGSSTSLPLTVQRMENHSIQLGGRMKVRVKRRYLEEMQRIKAEVGEEGLSSDDEQIIRNVKENEIKFNILPEFDPYIKNSTSTPKSGKSDSTTKEPSGPVNLDQEKMRSSLTQESQPSYFHLINDLFQLGTNNRLRITELDQGVSVWQESPIAALNSWYSLYPDPRGWRTCIPSAIAFLSGAFPEQSPPDFQPLIKVNSKNGCYQWDGEGRESSLCYLFDWWWDRKELCKASISSKPPAESGFELDGVESCDSGVPPGRVPPARYPTSWKVRPGSHQEKIEYRQQETERYSVPTVPYEWRVQDYRSCVGPVKGGLAVKGKNHTMLKSKRPLYVTILTLVRDAVSRLPNGEGSRSDIMELLLYSQYLTENIDQVSLNTTVSGALDRLQNETDSCVKYDTNRKIWIYLHRDKSLAELENYQANLKPKPRPKKKIKLDDMGDRKNARESILGSALLGTRSGSPSRSSLGSPSRSSLGSPARSTLGSPARSSLDSVSRSATGVPKTNLESTLGSSPGTSLVTSPRSLIGPGTTSGSPTRPSGISIGSPTRPSGISIGSPAKLSIGGPGTSLISPSKSGATIISLVSATGDGTMFTASTPKRVVKGTPPTQELGNSPRSKGTPPKLASPLSVRGSTEATGISKGTPVIREGSTIVTEKTPTSNEGTPTLPGSGKIQRIIVRGENGQILPLSPATLNMLIESGAVPPGVQILQDTPHNP
ncbi:nuclear factor related to kappa-B-binding protein-like isoform X2 [Eurytemora carolleeae]|uniref:nuclear factor related to kappa-B-binding protein-like isoform X2 n=1 Tax=Eurytemora carolleeae TaxID=1294199 RepID=UPI000C782C7B|nr:nuclear factor related to kappa-B-binding protein-like isoform X2 [Eurytemora carolleeae]|eukprot:XP_023326447.1 nuclear factor related to kappa-B-binding protein-like isoform X2 [Eurytemora affinis]